MHSEHLYHLSVCIECSCSNGLLHTKYVALSVDISWSFGSLMSSVHPGIFLAVNCGVPSRSQAGSNLKKQTNHVSAVSTLCFFSRCISATFKLLLAIIDPKILCATVMTSVNMHRLLLAVLQYSELDKFSIGLLLLHH